MVRMCMRTCQVNVVVTSMLLLSTVCLSTAITKRTSPYDVLQVPHRASLDQIKQAYRVRAKLAHPDKPGGNEELFREVQEAYEVLSDPERRRTYDATGFRTQEEQRDAERQYASSRRNMYYGGSAHPEGFGGFRHPDQEFSRHASSRQQQHHRMFVNFGQRFFQEPLASRSAELTARTFGTAVFRRASPETTAALVQIYHEGVAACHRVSPQWERVHSALNDLAVVGRVHATREAALAAELAPGSNAAAFFMHDSYEERQGFRADELPAFVGFRPGCVHFACRRYFRPDKRADDLAEALQQFVVDDLMRLPPVRRISLHDVEAWLGAPAGAKHYGVAMPASATTIWARAWAWLDDRRPVPLARAAVICFTAKDGVSNPVLRTLQREFAGRVDLRVVRWRDGDQAKAWRRMYGVSSAPAVAVFHERRGIPHNVVTNTAFGGTELRAIFKNAAQPWIPRLRLATAPQLGPCVKRMDRVGVCIALVSHVSDNLLGETGTHRTPAAAAYVNMARGLASGDTPLARVVRTGSATVALIDPRTQPLLAFALLQGRDKNAAYLVAYSVQGKDDVIAVHALSRVPEDVKPEDASKWPGSDPRLLVTTHVHRSPLSSPFRPVDEDAPAWISKFAAASTTYAVTHGSDAIAWATEMLPHVAPMLTLLGAVALGNIVR
ncbi:J domain-containing protein [Pseudoscourfieldia marina]